MASGAGTQDIARRYAIAFFELAKEQNAIDAIEKDLAAIAALVVSGAEFTGFMNNATLKRDDQVKALGAIAEHIKISALGQKFLGVIAQKRRLPLLGQIAKATQDLIAQHKGEASAEVVTAVALSDAQVKQIEANLKKALGVTVKANVVVDASIMGGLVIRVGSKLIDSSVRTKLDRLQRLLKNSNELTSQKKMKEVA